MKITAILLFLLPAAAWGQVPATEPAPVVGTITPCLHYPDNALAARAQGAIELSFHVAADGRLQNVRITKSSGNASLDAKTLSCWKAALYTPASRDGRFVAADHHERVAWTIEFDNIWNGKPLTHVEFGGNGAPPSPATVIAPQSIGKPHLCAEYYPAESMRLGVQGTTKVAFSVTARGTTSDVVVRASSGDKLLDDAAVYCVHQWLYQPATKNGAAIAVPWQAEVKWLLH